MTGAQKETIRVVIADDHPIVMAGFSMALTSFGIQVAGNAGTPADVLTIYAELLPDVLLMDIRLGEELSGLETAKKILCQHPDAKIVLLAELHQESLIREAYRIGAYAIITKACSAIELATAVTHASYGKLYFSPNVAARLASLSVRGDDSPHATLHPRELDVFLRIAKGQTVNEIAKELHISPKTVGNTSVKLKRKLGVTRAAEVTRLAIKFGLIEP